MIPAPDATEALLLTVGFALGLTLGYLLWGRVHVRRVPIDAGGHTDMVPTDDTQPLGRFQRLTRALDRPPVYVAGLALAVLLGLGANWTSLNASADSTHASHDSAHALRGVAALARCNALYNVAAGNARDERASVAVSDREAERQVWQSLYDQLSAPQGTTTLKDLLATIQARIDSIDAVDNTTLLNPYPDPDRCK